MNKKGKKPVASSSKVPGLEPGKIAWVRNPNLETKLAQFGVKWEWVTGIKLDTVLYDRNKSRFTAEIDKVRVVDLALKILEHGMALPGCLFAENGGKKECIGGFHRSAACRDEDINIRTVDGYVVYDIGEDTKFELSIVDNNFEGKGLSLEERLELAAAEVRAQKEQNIIPDLVRLAARLDMPLDKLEAKILVSEFRILMTQPGTQVFGGEKIPDSAIKELLRVKTLNRPVQIAIAQVLARLKEASGRMTTDILQKVKAAPKSEAEQLARITEIEAEWREKLEKRKAESGKKRTRSFTTDVLILADLTRLLNTTKPLESGNVLDLFQGERREQFLALAKQTRERLLKAIKTLE